MVAERGAEPTYRCGSAARWLPRSLGGAVLLVMLLVAFDDRGSTGAVEGGVRRFLGFAGAVVALWIVRSGAELHATFRLIDRALVIARGRAESRLDLDAIERLDFAPAFSRPGIWVSAAVLVDRAGVGWRVPALLDGGAVFVRELVERAGRQDLRSWAEERDLARRMGRTRMRLWVGHGIATGVAASGIARWLGG
jgi:hypothetical protein